MTAVAKDTHAKAGSEEPPLPPAPGRGGRKETSLIGLGGSDLREWGVHGKAGLRKVLGVRKTDEEREEMERVLGHRSGKQPKASAIDENGGKEASSESSHQVAIRV